MDPSYNHYTENLVFTVGFSLPDLYTTTFEFTIFADAASACEISDPPVSNTFTSSNQYVIGETSGDQIVLPPFATTSDCSDTSSMSYDV